MEITKQSNEYGKRAYITIEDMKKVIDNPDISVVSFDIFDTLLVRPKK